ncbi:acyltransferase family protein [Citrobacter rodentium]|jgi:Predicted membrane protein|uniref:Acyltransferase n=2 Tax=Citrobacter rodentium TaxID=67825 RepID=D2TTV3_CITRI|nr:acyltransferase family protein [Citrobacter rodentium]KIQ51365.1 membrane protein [Citrobacter rodentium]QBY27789.1 hypothetical protein E2R62_02380 [Citrobacter rodentium]UHO30316.1 acyltransferase family protein [Citrobacter rodentium NBRC 105723 = DSM 16636]CBG87948.1 putative acyltransferase [Citrobacter rodentium ICC168]HAT8012941.1 hypothetical protein [Citrobacter rodentium NBRC 105723 = DSM 16636]
MKKKELWINQIKGLCICLVVIYHSVITFYPHLTHFQYPFSHLLAKCWIYFNLYLAPFRMPVFFFISGFLIRRYISDVSWKESLDKRVWNIFWVLALWGVAQWLAITALNGALAPERELNTAANAAYAASAGQFLRSMLTASTSLWYLYALIVYFAVCKIFSRQAKPLFVCSVALSIAINFLPTPWWGMNSVIRNLPYYSLGAWFGVPLMQWIKEVPLRRYALACSAVSVLAVAAWLFNVSLLLSVVSIVLIMKLFYQYEQRFGMRESGLMNVIGSNTIAIYTTHRILVEAFSLLLIPAINGAVWSPRTELALLLVYPFISLLVCTLFGLAVRKLSQGLLGDILFSPPSRPAVASYSR